MHKRIQVTGSAVAGMTLSTPTNVCIPLISQRTSSHSTALCKSGSMTSLSIGNQSHQPAHQQSEQCDPEHNSINRKRHKTPLAHPMHKPGHNAEGYKK